MRRELSRERGHLEIPAEQLARCQRVWDHSFESVLRDLQPNSQQAMCGIDVGHFKRADLLAAESCIVGHRQHHSISHRLLLTTLKNVLPPFSAWNPREPVMPLV